MRNSLQPKQLGFVYKLPSRLHSANPLSLFKNMSAASRIGHGVKLFFVAPDRTTQKPSAKISEALDHFGIVDQFPLIRIPHITLAKRGGAWTFALLSTLMMKRHQIDICWSRDIHTAYFATLFGIPTLLEYHTIPRAYHFHILKRVMLLKTFIAFVAISEAHMELLTKSGLPGEKIIAAHSGLDLRQFETGSPDRAITRELRHFSAGPVVLYAGSLYSGRGIEQILQVASQLQHVNFVCIGGGDQEVSEYQRQAEEEGLRNVKFLGYIPNRSLPAYLLAADILVAPFAQDSQAIDGTVIADYASPLKLIEYLGTGKPIITSNLGAIPEILTHGQTAWLIEPGNAAELGEAIQHLLENPDRSQELGQAARELAGAYTWDKRVEMILTVVESQPEICEA